MQCGERRGAAPLGGRRLDGTGPGSDFLSHSGMSRPHKKIASGAKSDFWAPKVTFCSKSDFWDPKVTLGHQKSLFRSRSHFLRFLRFRPPEKVEFYKHYKGFAAVARAGAKKADFAEFSGKSTF